MEGAAIFAEIADPVLSKHSRVRKAKTEIAKRMGRQALQQVALVAKPETILAWYRKLIARKFDGSKHRDYPGRPAVSREITELVVRMAQRIPVGDTTALLGH